MRYIPADFNRLGMMEPNEITLAPLGWPTYEQYHLQDGERVIAYEGGSLEAEGVVRLIDVEGDSLWWVIAIDPATMRDIEPSESSITPTPATPA